jgi:hypothetical protein
MLWFLRGYDASMPQSLALYTSVHDALLPKESSTGTTFKSCGMASTAVSQLRDVDLSCVRMIFCLDRTRPATRTRRRMMYHAYSLTVVRGRPRARLLPRERVGPARRAIRTTRVTCAFSYPALRPQEARATAVSYSRAAVRSRHVPGRQHVGGDRRAAAEAESSPASADSYIIRQRVLCIR